MMPPSATCLLILGQHSIINQSNLRDKITVYVKWWLINRVMCFYISVIHLSFPSEFRGMGRVIGLGEEIWLGLHFWTTVKINPVKKKTVNY